ncbi:MAG: hypothetical protein MUO19_02460 [Dehalococcoidales bacterium]|nr:hypothetical protein [Dehalococcoidales bacterium]
MKRVLTGLLLVITLVIMVSGCRNNSDDDIQRAAIIDQLYVLESNPEFNEKASRMMESYGFTVDIWQGSEITVDFYRELPTMGYKLIVFRVHSGLLISMEGDEPAPLDYTYLFTAENYTTTRYVTDQLSDKVSNALISDEYPLVFAVNSHFILDAKGRFENTVILAMGCESYYYNDMPEAFLEKGASAYVGWDTIVSLAHVDAVTLDLLDNLCTDNATLAEATAATMADLGEDPYFHAVLRFTPPESADKTVQELIK